MSWIFFYNKDMNFLQNIIIVCAKELQSSEDQIIIVV